MVPGPYSIKCDNGHFHNTPPETLNIGIGIRIRMENVHCVAPCPECGANGTIEDGYYWITANFRQRLRMAWSVLWKGYV